MRKTTKHFVYGLLIRVVLLFLLPALMDDGLLLPGVRYTDIDYDVFTDAAKHVAEGRSPYLRHTYRYTPFLAALLSFSITANSAQHTSLFSVLFSTKYFGKILFCVADAICGYIILILRSKSRKKQIVGMTKQQQNDNNMQNLQFPMINRYILRHVNLSPELIDALWWLYNPLPINICTRGSAEALVVLLPVLVTVALTVDAPIEQQLYRKRNSVSYIYTIPIPIRASFAGILHGIGIHCKLYPVIYTVSFMANFSRQQQQRQLQTLFLKNRKSSSPTSEQLVQGWTHDISEQMDNFQKYIMSDDSSPQSSSGDGFPWKHPIKIIVLAIFWIQRLFFTLSSVLFLVSSIITMAVSTYAAVHYYGNEALEEGLLYHFGRIDHRHNYSMYWYWIYLLRGSSAVGADAATPSTWVGNLPLIPQILSECVFNVCFDHIRKSCSLVYNLTSNTTLISFVRKM